MNAFDAASPFDARYYFADQAFFEKLKALDEQANQVMEITEFVPLAKIDPVYFDKGYYLSPGKGGDKADMAMAGGTDAATETAPVRASSETPGLVVETRLTVALTPSTAGAPLTMPGCTMFTSVSAISTAISVVVT